MDWPYTDCPTLCTCRALTAEDLQSSAPGLVVEADVNGTDFSVSRGGDGDDRDGNILEIGVHTYSLDESLDFFEYVRDVSGRDDLRFCYWVDCETYEDGHWTHGDLALTIVEALARRCDGVIAVWLERVVWGGLVCLLPGSAPLRAAPCSGRARARRRARRRRVMLVRCGRRW